MPGTADGGFLSKIGIGGKSFADSIQGRNDNRFSKLFDDYHLNLGFEGEEAIKITLNELGLSADQVSESLMNAAKTSKGAITGITKVGAAAKTSSLGMKLLATAGNILVTALASLAITGAIKLFEYITTTQQRLEEAAQAAKDDLAKEETALADINSELEETRKLIDGLEGRELTFVEEAELERLKQHNKELELEKKLQEEITRIKEKEARKTAVKAATDKQVSMKNVEEEGSSLYTNLDLVRAAVANHGIDGFDASSYGRPLGEIQAFPDASFMYKEYLALNKDMLPILKKQQQENQKAYYDAIEKAGKEISEQEQKDIDSLQLAWQNSSALYDQAFAFVKGRVDYLDTTIGDLEKVKNPQTDTDKQFNALFDERDALNEYLYSFIEADEQFISDTVLDKYAKSASKLQSVIQESGEISSDRLVSEFGDIVSEFEKYGWSLEDITRHLNEVYTAGETKDPIPSYAEALSSLFKNTEQYTTITDAIAEQAEAGKISAATMKALTDISPDFINYLEKTADGYQINTDALMDYIEAHDLLKRTTAIKAIKELNEELSNADITGDRRNEILAEIQKWKMLVSEIDSATGALAEYRAAEATQNQDSAFQEGVGMYEMMKEAIKLDKTGTDDFQKAVSFMLGEDWEQKIGDIYATRDKAYNAALKNAETYFGQETESDNYKNFVKALIKNEFGKYDKAGNAVLENLSTIDVAEKLGLSQDAVLSLFGLMEAYEIPVTYDVAVDTSEVEYAEAVINELKERRETAQLELGKAPVGSETHARLSSQISELDKQIGIAERNLSGLQENTALTIDEAISYVKELTEYKAFLTDKGFDIPLSVSGDIDALNTLLGQFEIATDTDGNVIGYKLEVNGADEATTLIEQFESGIKSVQDNEDVSVSMKATVEEQGKVVIDELKAFIESGEESKTFVIEVDDQTSGLLQQEQEKDPDAVIIDIGFDEEKLNAVENKREELAEPIHTKVIFDQPEDNTSTVSQENDIVANPVPASDSGSKFVEDVQQQVDESAKDVKIDSKGKKYGLVQAVEDMLAAKNRTSIGHSTASGYQDMPIAVDVPKKRLAFDVGAEVDSNLGAQIAEDVQAQLDNEQIMLEAQADIDTLIESSNVMLSMAESADVAQDKQDSLKSATEALGIAFDNLKSTDPYNAGGWQDASNQLNSAVSNYVQAYNSLADDLSSISPVNVSANISSAQRSINSLNGKVVTITVKTNTISTTVAGQPVTSGSTGTTGATNASGTTFARGGTSLVDEEGAELIEHVSEGTYELGTNKGPRFTKLNKGDIVHTASETKKILSRMGGAIGGFFRDGLNKTKSVIGKAFASGTDPWGMGIVLDTKIKKDPTDPWKQDIVVDTVIPSNKLNTNSSSSNKKGSGSSGSSSKKSAKNLEDFLAQLFDWIEVRLARLQDQTDGWLAQVAEAVGYVAKNAKLDNALTSVSKQIEANTKGYAKYMEAAEKIADKFDIDPELIKLIQEGEIEIAKYDEDTQKKIKAYQEWYEKAIDCKNAIADLREQERELATQKLDNIIDHYQWQIDRLDAIANQSDLNIELKQATGRQITTEDYTDAITATFDKMGKLAVERDKLQEEFDSLVERGLILEGSEEWYNYISTIEELEASITEAHIATQELIDASRNIELTNLQYALAGIERSASKIQNYMSLHEAQGLNHAAEDYEKLINNGMAQIENLKAQNKLLEKQQIGLDKNSEKWQEIQEQIDSNNQSISDMMVSQEQWNDSVVDIKIKEIQDLRDSLSKTNTQYENQLRLQQSLEDLEKAKSQRTQRIFRNNEGFVFEADQDAVQDAQNAFDQELNNQILYKLDELIEAVEDSKSDTNVYDANGVLLGEQYTLPSFEDIASYFSASTGSNIVNDSMKDIKNAAYEQALSGITTQQNATTLQIGDIVVQGVDNANALAEALIDEFPNAFLQALYNKG